MSMRTRTLLAVILRQHAQGIIDDAALYHAICNLYVEEQ